MALTKPWIRPAWRRSVTGTPAASSLAGVALALVAQRIEAGRGHVGRRQAVQIVRQQRGGARIAGGGLVRKVVPAKPVHLPLRQEEAFAEEPIALVLRREVRHGIDQELEDGPRPALSHAQSGGDRGQVAAGAVAAHGHARGLAAELRRVLRSPAEGRRRILHRGGEAMLGRQPVVDREHVHAGVSREEAAGAVVGVEVADHPAAAVVVDEERAPRAGSVG